MTTITVPLVGMYHHRPALAITDNLAIGTELKLRTEPDNAYDPNAIMVWIDTTLLDSVKDLDDALAGYGTSIAILQSEQSAFHLGYIARDFAADLKSRGFPEDADVKGIFTVNTRGKPQVRVEDW